MKAQIEDEIVSMIKNTNRHSKQLTSAAEKPILISGAVRSDDAIGIPGLADIKPKHVTIGAGEHFLKTYKILHKSR